MRPVLTDVLVGVDVFIGVPVAVGVLLGVAEGPSVGTVVAVGVLVGVDVGPDAKVNTSCGGEVPSLEWKETPSVLSGKSTKL